MSNRRRRRNTTEPKKPFSTTAYVAAGVAGASLVICLGTLLWSYSVAGNTPRLAGGISMLAFVASVLSFFAGAGVFRNQTYNRKSRWIGLIVPAIAFVVWIGIYVAGLVIG
ncbi:MAG: hypothetical protein K6A05_03090 [Lachnospiraceae bacterium]|nr:hypothetical protein [Lachnospiraceae bacterium]